MSAADDDIRAAFARLRPLCVTLTREHQRDHVADLKREVAALDEAALRELQEYVMFPLRLILKQSQSKSCDLYADVCSCLALVLSRTEVPQWSVWMDIFSSLCTLISPPPSSDGPAAVVSEELKLEAVQCLSVLLKGTDFSVLAPLYEPMQLPPLGHAVNMLLMLAEHETSRQLRQEAICCLMDLTLLSKNRRVRASDRVRVGNAFASFLPGISMAMVRLATGDPKQGHNITVQALELLSSVVAMVMGDDELRASQRLREKSQVDERIKNLVVQRTEDWVTMTTEKMKILFERLLTLKTHSNWKVRLGLVHWAELLLQKCDKSLSVCVPVFLEILVGSVGDDYGNVASAAQAALANYRDGHQGDNENTLVEILEENLYTLATQLPRLVRTLDDTEKLSHLSLFAGYLQLLGPSTPRLLTSHAHLQRAALALIQVTELDCSQVKVIAERTSGTDVVTKNQPHTQRPRKYFKHFVDEKIYNTVVRICHLLGCYGDLDLLVDHFLDLYQQGALHRKQATFCINEIILGTTGTGLGMNEAIRVDTEHLQELISQVIEEYLNPVNFDLVTSIQSEQTTLTEQPPDWQRICTNDKTACSLEQLNSNILQVCLQLEGLANFAQVLGESFQVHLIHVLYAVLEKLGSETALVSQTAACVLQEIADALALSGTEELIRVNADYLVNSLSLRLRHLEQHPSAPEVLRVILHHSQEDVLPLVQHSIQEILLVLDDHYDNRAAQFMRILYHLVVAIARWFPTEPPENEAIKDQPVSCKNSSAADFLLHYHQQKQIAADFSSDAADESLEDGVPSDDMTSGDAMETDEKKEPQQHIKIVMEILSRCVHLQSAPDPRLRLLVLRTIAQACPIMQQSENDFLPLIHQLWPPFVQRFHDEEKLVTVEAFHTLAVMGRCSRDFIRQRIIKDILDKLTSTLQQQAAISAQTGPAYKYTVAYKQQEVVLRHAGNLCRDCDVTGRHMSAVMRACLPYLSARQPSGLQEACVQSLQVFCDLDPGSVWLLLGSACAPDDLSPPHAELPHIKLPGSRERNEYSDNIGLIMSQLSET